MLRKACDAGHLSTVEILISHNANVNKINHTDGHTPLSLACAGGHVAIVQLLLEHSADPFHKLNDNSTIVLLAAKKG